MEMPEAIRQLSEQQASLEQVLRALPPESWSLPTPAQGWDVRDSVSHLADSEELAHDTTTGGPRQINEEALSFPSPDAFTRWGCDKGREMSPEQILDWWLRSAEKTRTAFAAVDPKVRVPWGLGMTARTLVTARLMETWAHGLDIRAAVGEPPDLTPRLREVAWIVIRALPYAFSVAKREQPPGTLRVELAFEGETWTFGPEDADNQITGDAGEFCMVGVQRMKLADATSLKAEGALAEAALEVARAYL